MFNPERVHLIDYFAGTNTFLFRGNEPLLKNMSFAYQELQSALANASAKVNGPAVPEDVYLVDVNLLEIERSSIASEVSFFNANPKLGVFVHRPVFGALTVKRDKEIFFFF